MRFQIGIAAAVAAVVMQAAAAAAQVQAEPGFAAAGAVTPLPARLTPDAHTGAGDAAAGVSVRRVLVSTGIGALAGAGAGLVVGAITTDGCQPDEDWCILSWEEEVAIHGVAGALAGAGVGAVYGLVSGPRRPRTEPAPVTVAPAPGGSLRVGLTLRH